MVKLKPTTDPVLFLLTDVALVRVLRWLLTNQSGSLTAKELASHVQQKLPNVKTALKALESAGVVLNRKLKSGKGYYINERSNLIEPLRQLLRYDFDANRRDLAKAFRSIGKPKAVIATGDIVGNRRSEVDLVIVSDNVNERSLEKLLLGLGYKSGFELRYVVLTTKEYYYRLEMNDRLLRNVVDFEHQFLIGSKPSQK